jgi:hypothetical protein
MSADPNLPGDPLVAHLATVRALQPWIENPYTLISWPEIMKFSAAKFYALEAIHRHLRCFNSLLHSEMEDSMFLLVHEIHDRSAPSLVGLVSRERREARRIHRSGKKFRD